LTRVLDSEPAGSVRSAEKPCEIVVPRGGGLSPPIFVLVFVLVFVDKD